MATQRILLIDDDPMICDLVSLVMESAGFAVTTTDSALGAVELVRSVKPDAIILDLGLPYRSGATLLRDLKDQPDLAPIPVVILSGMAEMLTGSRRDLAAAVLSKPFATDALIYAIRNALAAA
jgi:CheY-like chemotaxis protein